MPCRVTAPIAEPASPAAGIMASNSGSASVAPTPRSIVRRDKEIRLLIQRTLHHDIRLSPAFVVASARPLGPAFLEGIAGDDLIDQGGEAVPVLRDPRRDLLD